jgi:hypothetical protein
MLCKRWRNTYDELVPGSFIFVPGFRDKKYQSKTKRGQNLDKKKINGVPTLPGIFSWKSPKYFESDFPGK